MIPVVSPVFSCCISCCIVLHFYAKQVVFALVYAFYRSGQNEKNLAESAHFRNCEVFQLFGIGGGDAYSGIITYPQPFKMEKVRNYVDFLCFLLNRFNWVTMLMGFT